MAASVYLAAKRGLADRHERNARLSGPANRAGWQRRIDTSRESPEDIVDASSVPLVVGARYRVAPRSAAALFLRIDPGYGSSKPGLLRL